MTAGEQLRAEGRAEGRLEGRAEGRLEGRAEGLRGALLKMLELKFGAAPPGLAERLRGVDADTLERWIDRVLEAERIEDIFD